MPQYLPAGGGLPPRQVVKNVPGSVVYTTAQGGGEVQPHAALPDIARGGGWPQKVYMCQGALGMPRQKGVSKEGKHCRPVGHKILLASIAPAWAEAGNRLHSHMVYSVTRVCRCARCKSALIRVKVVTRYTFGSVRLHEVETEVVNGAAHSADPGPASARSGPKKPARTRSELSSRSPAGLHQARTRSTGAACRRLPGRPHC